MDGVMDNSMKGWIIKDGWMGRRHIMFIYLTPVKKQLLQNNLTQDLMLFYHSNELKA